jgi:hypothetical protein
VSGLDTLTPVCILAAGPVHAFLAVSVPNTMHVQLSLSVPNTTHVQLSLSVPNTTHVLLSLSVLFTFRLERSPVRVIKLSIGIKFINLSLSASFRKFSIHSDAADFFLQNSLAHVQFFKYNTIHYKGLIAFVYPESAFNSSI